jgi:hypothetical protein
MVDGRNRPRILCISFSDINRDARVLRQLDVLADLGEVTTVGYGTAPRLATEHLRIDSDLPSLPQTPVGVALLAMRRFDRVEFLAPAVRAALDLLEGKRYDIVMANEARAMALGHRVAQGAPVVADMHEWAPEERAHVLSWRLLVRPYMTYQCRKYLPEMHAVSVVNDSIGDLYRNRFGIHPRTVRNTGRYHDLEPGEVREGAIRLVHSGAAIPGRNLETLIQAVTELPPAFTFDLYLVPGRDGGRYLDGFARWSPATRASRCIRRSPPTSWYGPSTDTTWASSACRRSPRTTGSCCRTRSSTSCRRGSRWCSGPRRRPTG